MSKDVTITDDEWAAVIAGPDDGSVATGFANMWQAIKLLWPGVVMAQNRYFPDDDKLRADLLINSATGDLVLHVWHADLPPGPKGRRRIFLALRRQELEDGSYKD